MIFDENESNNFLYQVEQAIEEKQFKEMKQLNKKLTKN